MIYFLKYQFKHNRISTTCNRSYVAYQKAAGTNKKIPPLSLLPVNNSISIT